MVIPHELEMTELEINELELRNKKTGNIIKNDSRLVPGVGLEPTRTLRSTGF